MRRYCELVIATCHDSSLVNYQLISAFSDQITLSSPTPTQRQQIIQAISFEKNLELSPSQLRSITVHADGMSSTPLLSFVHGIRRVLPQEESKPDTFLESFIGSDEVKRVIMESIVWPRQHSEVFRKYRLTSETGILLYGPPGTGKTFFPQYIAQTLGYSLVNIRLTEVVRGEIGSGEHRLRELFRQAKHLAPSILFIDEFQAIFGMSDDSESGMDSLSAALSSCLDDINNWNEHAGVMSQVLLIAATNEPWAIDRSFLRPGRFDRHLYLGPLSIADRVKYIHQQLLNFTELENGSMEEVIESIAEMSDGYTAADMKLFFKRLSRELSSRSLTDDAQSFVDFVHEFVSTISALPNQHHLRSSVIERYESWSYQT